MSDWVCRGEVESNCCEGKKKQAENIERYRDGKGKGEWACQMGFVACEKSEETTC